MKNTEVEKFLACVSWLTIQHRIYMELGTSATIKLRTRVHEDLSEVTSLRLPMAVQFDKPLEEFEDDSYEEEDDNVDTVVLIAEECVVVQTSAGLRLGIQIAQVTEHAETLDALDEQETVISAQWDGSQWKFTDTTL